MTEQHESPSKSRDLSTYDLFIAVVAVISMALVIWRFTLTEGTELAKLIDTFDLAFCAIFFADYIRNIVIGPNRLKYIFTWGIFDLVSSIPAYGPLRLIRIARVLRVLRALRSIRILIQVTRRDRAAATVAGTMITAILLIIGICVAVLDVEQNAPGAKITTAEDVTWWAVVTTSTVGYGDVTPVTQTGRVLAVGLMVIGIGLFATFAGALSGLILRRPGREVREELDITEHRLERIEAQNAALMSKLDTLSKQLERDSDGE